MFPRITSFNNASLYPESPTPITLNNVLGSLFAIFFIGTPRLSIKSITPGVFLIAYGEIASVAMFIADDNYGCLL